MDIKSAKESNKKSPRLDKSKPKKNEQHPQEKLNHKKKEKTMSNPKMLAKKIQKDKDSEYHSDSSDEAVEIRTGKVPREWYDEFNHLGYNINASKVDKPAKEDEIEKFLKKAKDKDYWRNIHDELNNKSVFLSDQDLEVIKRIRKNLYANKNIADDDTYFERNIPYQIFPLSNRMTPKKAFLPSKNEQKYINYLAKLIRENLISVEDEDKKPKKESLFDIWQFENTLDNTYHPGKEFTMPKPIPPDSDLSYNPPEELKDDSMKEAEISLRKIPKYPNVINEQFDRCLDIFQSTRIIKKKEQISEESILPELPNLEDLKPYPTKENIVFNTHSNVIKSICFDTDGHTLISADLAGFIHFSDVVTTKVIYKTHLNYEILKIRYNEFLSLVSICCKEGIYFIQPKFLTRGNANREIVVEKLNTLIEQIKDRSNNVSTEESAELNASGESENGEEEANKKSQEQSKSCTWKIPTKSEILKKKLSKDIVFYLEWNDGDLIDVVWHSKGDFFSTLSKNQYGKTQVSIVYLGLRSLSVKDDFHNSFLKDKRADRMYFFPSNKTLLPALHKFKRLHLQPSEASVSQKIHQ